MVLLREFMYSYDLIDKLKLLLSNVNLPKEKGIM